jgi:hypothetical protein
MRPLRARARVTSVARLAGAVVAVLLAGCADFLATPAADGARLSLSLQPAGPARQTSPGQDFDRVDGLSVRVARGNAVVVADSFAVAAADGVIRQVVLIPLEADEEDVDLAVELHAGGQVVFAGGQALHLVRGQLATAEVELIPVGATDPGALFVDVRNALTGGLLQGAAVTVRRGANALPGDLVAGTAVTGSTGLAVFPSLPAGAYTLSVAAPGMIPAQVPGVGVVADTVTRRAVALSPVLSAGQTRIILTWAPAPNDLDAHLVGPDGGGGTFHVYSRNPFTPDSATADVRLDVDATEGFGPETITIREQFSGTYCFSVENLSGEVPLAVSGAKVRVFRGSEEVAAFSAPGTTASVWNVFRMSGDVITSVNTTSADVSETCP